MFDNVASKYFRNVSIQLASNVVVTVLSFAQTIILGRQLGVYNYGILALVMTYTQFVSQFVSFDMWEIVIKYGAEFLVKEKNAEFQATVKLGYLADCIAGGVAFLFAILLAGLASRYFFHNAGLIFYIYFYSLSILMLFIDNTSNAILRVNSQFRFMAIRDVIINGFKIVLLYLTLQLGYGLTGIIAVFLISILAQVLVNYVKVTGVLKIQPLKLILTADMSVIQGQKQEILKFVKHNYISQTWSMVIANLDTLALGFYRAPSEVGIYKMAKNFYSVAARMIEPFSVVIYPNLALLWSSENYLKYASLIRKSTAVVMLTATPLLIILSVFIPYILNYMVGNSFNEASDLTRILLVGGWVTAIFFWTRPSILVMGKTHVPPTVNFVNVVMVIGLTLYFVPLYGSKGSALICLVPILFGNIIVAYAVLKTYRERLKIVSVIN